MLWHMIRGRGGLFSVPPPSVQRLWNGTKFMQVMEQPHVAISQQRRAFFVPVLRGLSTLGAVIGLCVFWVAEPEKRPPCPPLKLSPSLLYSSSFWGTAVQDNRTLSNLTSMALAGQATTHNSHALHLSLSKMTAISGLWT